MRLGRRALWPSWRPEPRSTARRGRLGANVGGSCDGDGTEVTSVCRRRMNVDGAAHRRSCRRGAAMVFDRIERGEPEYALFHEDRRGAGPRGPALAHRLHGRLGGRKERMSRPGKRRKLSMRRATAAHPPPASRRSTRLPSSRRPSTTRRTTELPITSRRSTTPRTTSRRRTSSPGIRSSDIRSTGIRSPDIPCSDTRTLCIRTPDTRTLCIRTRRTRRPRVSLVRTAPSPLMKRRKTPGPRTPA